MSYQSVARYLVSKHIETDKETNPSAANPSDVSKQIAKQSETVSRQLTSKEAALLAASREAAKLSLAKEIYTAEQRFSKFLEEADLAADETEKAIAESKALQWFRAYQSASFKLLKASGQIKAAESAAEKEAERGAGAKVIYKWVMSDE